MPDYRFAKLVLLTLLSVLLLLVLLLAWPLSLVKGKAQTWQQVDPALVTLLDYQASPLALPQCDDANVLALGTSMLHRGLRPHPGTNSLWTHDQLTLDNGASVSLYRRTTHSALERFSTILERNQDCQPMLILQSSLVLNPMPYQLTVSAIRQCMQWFYRNLLESYWPAQLRRPLDNREPPDEKSWVDKLTREQVLEFFTRLAKKMKTYQTGIDEESWQQLLSLADNDVQLVLVELHPSPTLETATASLQGTESATLRQRTEAYPNIHYIEFNSLPSDDFYADYIHLNAAGRQLFQQWLSAELASLPQ